MKELLLGCGNSKTKRLWTPPDNTEWHDLTTLDMDANCLPDVVHDLNVTPYPFGDSTFDEIHAYEVIEHFGRQGDWKGFFDQFTELWRITKPDGLLFGTVPQYTSQWAWGDPGHTRIITLGSLTFLDQSAYGTQVGKTSMCDYRGYYNADWRLQWQQDQGESLAFCLRANRPTP